MQIIAYCCLSMSASKIYFCLMLYIYTYIIDKNPIVKWLKSSTLSMSNAGPPPLAHWESGQVGSVSWGTQAHLRCTKKINKSRFRTNTTVTFMVNMHVNRKSKQSSTLFASTLLSFFLNCGFWKHVSELAHGGSVLHMVFTLPILLRQCDIATNFTFQRYGWRV